MARIPKGRGAVSSPPPRFDHHHAESVDDDWYHEPAPDSIATTVHADSARTIISRNDSPDIGFSQSINPYRGCEHGCVYCLAGDTAISLPGGGTRMLAELRPGDEILGTVPDGEHRRCVKTRVLAHWRAEKHAWRITPAGGSPLVASADHRFLTQRGWTHVSSAGPGRSGMVAGDFLVKPVGLPGDPPGGGEPGAPGEVLAIDALPGTHVLFDITTGTGDFIANGFVSHNCYARPTHAWLGLSPGLDFETRLYFKPQAAERLIHELAAPRYVPSPIMLGANTDPYQPLERRLRVTRRILEVLHDCCHPVTIVTKSALIERDLDILAPMARDGLAGVMVSLTSLDPELKRRLEPRAASPRARLGVIRRLRDAGVPVGALIAPIIPGLTDHELERLLGAAAEAGARCAGYAVLRLPLEVNGLFRDWLEKHYPDRARHVMSRVRSIRDGHDNDPGFGSRMRGTGVDAALLARRFELATRRLGLGSRPGFALDSTRFRPPAPPGAQLPLL